MDAEPTVVEIRVHGVSGTPPENLLGEPVGDQIAGDDVARFFRRSTPIGPPGRPRTLEAFHWGRFTAGSPSRALWLVMIPFALLNLSRYMLLLKTREPMTAMGRFADAVLRLLGLVLTLMLTTNVAYVSLEILINQCLGDPACVQANGWLSFMDGWKHGPVLLVGIMPTLALNSMLWWFGRMTFLHDPAKPNGTGEWGTDTGDFGDPAFWYSSPKAPVLRAAHVGAACAVSGMLVASPLDPLVTSVLALPGALLLFVLAYAVWQGHDAEFTPGDVDPLRVPPWMGLLRWSAVGYLVLTIWITVGLKWTDDPAKEALRGFEAATNILAVVAMVSLVLLWYACRRLKRTEHGAMFFEVPKPFRPMFRGYAALVIAAFAVTLASGFSGGLAFWTANFIGKPVPDGEAVPDRGCGCAESAISLSSSYWTGALLWGVLAIVAVLGLLWVIWRRKREWRDDGVPRVVDQDYSTGEPKPRTLHKIVLQWRLALTKYRYHWALGLLSLLGGALVVAAGVIGFVRLLPWWQEVPPRWLSKAELVSGLGAWVVSGLLGGLLFVGLRSWQGQKMRTAVGVVWDLIAFWPRLAHPICPPPYGGRTALLLKRRVEVLKGKTIVLSGHSQGSVVCTAVVRLLSASTRSSVCLVTYGSQLQWAFARLFPTYMGYAAMVEMHGNLGGRWRSIYRWTDPLGGPVLTWPASGGEPHPTVTEWAGFGTDIRLIDPVTVGGDEATQPRSELRGHSGYYLDPRFDEVVADLAE